MGIFRPAGWGKISLCLFPAPRDSPRPQDSPLLSMPPRRAMGAVWKRFGFPKKVRVSRLPGALAPKKSWNSPIKKSEFSNKKSGKKIGVRPERKVEGYDAEFLKWAFSEMKFPKFWFFCPKKRGGLWERAWQISFPEKAGFSFIIQYWKRRKKDDSGKKRRSRNRTPP